MKKIFTASLIILAAVQFSGCGKKIDQGPANNGMLSQVRTALQVYYGETEGVFPDNLESLTRDGKYLAALPKLKLPGHGETNEVLYLSGPEVDPSKLTDTGGYAYYNSKKYPQTYGMVIFNCTHKDEKGSPMHSF